MKIEISRASGRANSQKCPIEGAKRELVHRHEHLSVEGQNKVNKEAYWDWWLTSGGEHRRDGDNLYRVFAYMRWTMEIDSLDELLPLAESDGILVNASFCEEPDWSVTIADDYLD
jgi:hypothetical protein